MFYLRTFGGFSLESEEGPVSGPGAQRRRLAVLALLSAAPSGSLTRDKLAGYLWGESDQETARGLVGDAIYALRKALGRDALVSVGEEVRLDRLLVRSDVAELNQAFARREFVEVVRLYRGPFMDGVFVPEAREFEEWVAGQRTELARRYASSLEAQATEYEERGDYLQAVELLRKLAAHEPSNSRIARRLMENLVAAGDRTGALAHARIHSTVLTNEFDTVPPTELTAFVESLRRDHSLDTAPPVPNTIPAGSPVALARPPWASSGAEADPQPTRSVEPSARPKRRAAAYAATTLVAALILIGWLLLRDDSNGIRSVAVLPLENLTGDSTQEFLSDGLTEALITELAHLPGLRVISRTSVMQYKGTKKRLPDIARELRVDALVEGSIMRVAGRVRITAQLIDGGTDEHIWTEHYEKRFDDLSGVQTEVANAIAREVGIKLVPLEAGARRRLDPHAHEAFLKGLYYFGVGDLGQSTQAYERAIALDPGHAMAHAELAHNYYFITLFGYATPADGFEKMRNAAAQALQVDPSVALAHAALGLYEMHYRFNFAAADDHFRRSIQLNPNHADTRHFYAHYLLAMGRPAESAEQTRKASEIAPLDPVLVGCVGWHHIFDRNYQTAIAQSMEGIRIDPQNFWAHVILGWAYELAGRYPDAVGVFTNAAKLSGGSPLALASLGHALAKAGNRTQAEGLLRELKARAAQEYISPFDIATVYAGLGDRSATLEWLRKAQAQRAGFVVHVGWDPRFRALRSDSVFQRILLNMGLPTTFAKTAGL